MDARDVAIIFKALSDENRLHIVELIANADDICACRVLDELDIRQPTLSHHMKILCSCGLVDCRKEGKWMHYSLNRETFSQVKLFISSL